jgi:Cu(I)/Ag(I) efflux system membrane fusion protein
MPTTTTLGPMQAPPKQDDAERSPHSAHGEQGDHGNHGGQAAYVCPMHPEVVSKEPGKCPICGMKLQPKKAGQ